MKKFILLLALLVGCVSPDYQPHGSVVAIRQPKTIGTGVVIGENLVITAAHVVDEDGYIKIKVSKNPFKTYTEFRRLADMTNQPENIVCLYGPHEFSPTSIFKLGCKDEPFMVQTRRGLFELTEYNSQRGDSGSAVMCKHGHLLGVHYGSNIALVRKGKEMIEVKQPIFLLFKD